MKRILWVATLALATTPAWADFTFSPFSPGNVSPTWTGQALTGAPADTYVGFEVLADWSAVSGNPWSNESRVFFSDVIGGGSATLPTGIGVSYTTGAVSAANGASNGNPLFNLRFAGGFATAFNGTDPLALNFRQTFGGSVADWQNVRVTLKTMVIPTATDLGTLSGPLSITGSLAAGEVKWYKFTIDQAIDNALGTFLDIDTEGSLLAPSNDTELGLYAANGTFITTDDDDGTALLSQLTYGEVGPRPAPGDGLAYNGRDGSLAPGTYYIALGAFNTAFSNFFSVSSASQNIGDYALNINTNVPEPASLLLVTLLGALIRRR
ncbi:MAG: hypothetical protein IPM18_12925 [Phycisphaerales bacterium]|nr:hypothetical protein [Phycisphaerales bacterium]